MMGEKVEKWRKEKKNNKKMQEEYEEECTYDE